MPNLKKMYIVKLLSGSVIGTGSFLAKDENNIIYFASSGFLIDNQNIFSDIEQNENYKWAVIIDDEGTGRWAGSTFRNIQFISSNKTFCTEFKILEDRRQQLRYKRMEFNVNLIELLESNQDSSKLKSLGKEISIFDDKFIKIEQELEELNQKNINQ